MIVVFLRQLDTFAKLSRAVLTLRYARAIVLQMIEQLFSVQGVSFAHFPLIVDCDVFVAAQATLVAMDFRAATLVLDVLLNLLTLDDLATILGAVDRSQGTVVEQMLFELVD